MNSPCFSNKTECVFQSTGHSEKHAQEQASVLRQNVSRMGFYQHRVGLLSHLNGTYTIQMLVFCSPGQNVEALCSLFLLTVEVTPETPNLKQIVREYAPLDAMSQSIQALSVIADMMKLTMTTKVFGLVVTCTFT